MDTSQTITCRRCALAFSLGESEFAMYKKLDMPIPRDCFQCRIEHKLSFWVFGKFRKGKSDLSGESLITNLPLSPAYPIYTSHEWFSDAWDPMVYGRDYDPNRAFFEQFKELKVKVPHPHQTGKNNVGCDWCDDVWDSRECYLSRSLANCENTLYGYRILGVKDSVDVAYCFDTEKAYDATYCFKCFNVRHVFNCKDCINGAFLYDCRNVQDCFMCWNLRNKQYCIRNEQYSKEEYLKKISEYNLGSWETIQSLRSEFQGLVRERAVHRENFNFKTVESSGNYLSNCKQCNNCFYWEESEDCYNCFRGLRNKTIIDCIGIWQAELCGNIACATGGYMVKSSSWTSNCRYSEYLDQCFDCEYCFGCVGLQKKKYCILNKQYSKEEYEVLRKNIVETMKREGIYGDFFPFDIAPSGYNFSVSQIFFPKKKEEALKIGMFWESLSEVATEGMTTKELRDEIKNVDNAVSAKALICPETGFKFNIAPRELDFYRQNNTPLPRTHFDARLISRLRQIVTTVSYEYSCTFCNKNIESYYPKEWGYKCIACEDCYQKEVV